MLSLPCAADTEVLVEGVKAHNVEVLAQDAMQQFTVSLGSAIMPEAPYRTTISLNRSLVGGESLLLRDLQNGMQSNVITVGPANRPWVATVSPIEGPRTGGTIVTLTGNHFGPTTDVLFVAPYSTTPFQAQVVSCTETELVVLTPNIGSIAPGTEETYYVSLSDPRLGSSEIHPVAGFAYSE